jgi:hypothetical protein
MNTDHIIHNSNTQRMECQHCGFSEAIKMPAPIDAIVGKMDAFTKAHEGCKRPPSEAIMSEYIKGFDAGYAYVLTELERFAEQERQPQASHDAMTRRIKTEVLYRLLSHLKMEDKPDIREST